MVAPHRASEAEVRQAVTQCEVLERSPPWQLLLLQPITGRSHQLRVQCASRGLPIVGDLKYGSTETFGGIALHAARVTFQHPISKESTTIAAPLPPSWKRWHWHSAQSPYQ